MKRILTTIVILINLNLNAQSKIGETFNADLTLTERGLTYLSFKNADYQYINDYEVVGIYNSDSLYQFITDGMSKNLHAWSDYKIIGKNETLRINFDGKKVSFWVTQKHGVTSYSSRYKIKQINQLFGK